MEKKDDETNHFEWPEEIAKQIRFYYNHNNKNNDSHTSSSSSSSSSTSTSLPPYHLTYRTNMKTCHDSNLTTSQKELILYHESTNEIVDRIHTNDIIGVELEIAPFDTNHDKGGGDDSNTDNNNNEKDYSNEVGQGNKNAKQRAKDMELYEKEIGKALLVSGNIDDFSTSPTTCSNYDSDDKKNVVEDNEYEDNEDNDQKSSTLQKDPQPVPMIPTSKSCIYLNLYCYPKRKPQPSLITIVKNCIKSTVNANAKSTSYDPLKVNHLLDDELEDSSSTSSTGGDSSYSGDSSTMQHRYEHHRRYKLYSTEEDFTSIQSLLRAIKQVANLNYKTKMNKKNPTRYFVIVNPFSGQKQGKQIYESIVKKMIEECSAIDDHDILMTKYQNHAFERMQKVVNDENDDNHDHDDNDSAVTKERDISEYDAIICMGGDGILSEVLNGLKMRDDYDEILQKIKFGIVGCGTCNGLAASVLYAAKESYGPLESMFLICKGNTSKLDLATYETKNNKYLSFLTMTWAMIADIDIESECIRFLGVLRNDIWGAWRVLNLRTYKAKFSYLPPSADDTISASTVVGKCPKFDTDELPSNWITMEADFLLFWASNVTHAAHNVLQSPESRLQDGVFRIWIVRKPCSRIKMAGMLIEMENGNHTKYKNAEFIDCVAFRLDPISKGSFNDVDGEVVEAGRIQSSVHPGKALIFA